MDALLWSETGGFVDEVVEGVDRAFASEDGRVYEVIHFSEAEATLLANTIREVMFLGNFPSARVILRSDLRVVIEKKDEQPQEEKEWCVRFIFDGHDTPDLIWSGTEQVLISASREFAAKAKAVSARRRAEFIKELKLALNGDADGGKKPAAS